jgi:nucleosome binding factor SPN SPT16 subunit
VEQFQRPKTGSSYPVNVLFKTVDEKNPTAGILELIETLKADTGNKSNPKVASFLKEKQSGSLAEKVEKVFSEHTNDQGDFATYFQEMVSKKSESDLKSVAQSCYLTEKTMKQLMQQVEDTIEDEVSISHSELSARIEKWYESEKTTKELEKAWGVDPRAFSDLAYAPIIQSGGNYDMKVTAAPDENAISCDTIVLRVGSKFKGFFSNQARTMFIDPDPKQKAVYILLLEIQKKLVAKLRPGTKVSEVIGEMLEYAKSKEPSLEGKFQGGQMGASIGVEFWERLMVLSGKNDRKVEVGMVFNLAISVSGLTNQKGKPYAIALADTISVEAKENRVLTASVRKDFNEVSFTLDDGDKDKIAEVAQGSSKTNGRGSTMTDDSKDTRGGRGRRNEATLNNMQNDLKRRQHQQELSDRKLEELKERLANNEFGRAHQREMVEKVESLKSYDSIGQFPTAPNSSKLFIDNARETLLIPFGNTLVPFHIATIKSVSGQTEGKLSTIRINFHVPGSSSLVSQGLRFPDPRAYGIQGYIHELSLKSKNDQHMNQIIKGIKETQKKIKQRLVDKSEGMHDIEQEPLQVLKGKRPILSGVKMRPKLPGKATSGALEAHANGFRYSTDKGDRIDFTYSNIKQAYFQPITTDIIILVHFHLHSPLIIQKKRTYDLQFFMEAGNVTEDLVGRRGRSDRDEEEEELREKEHRKRLDRDFESFVRAAQHTVRPNSSCS